MKRKPNTLITTGVVVVAVVIGVALALSMGARADARRSRAPNQGSP